MAIAATKTRAKTVARGAWSRLPGHTQCDTPIELRLMGLGRIAFLTFVLQFEPRRHLIEHAVDEAS